jgi:uncharacterized protein involved in exopolysaccharide biosynthesis
MVRRLEAQLGAAEARVTALEAQLAEVEGRGAALEAQLAEAGPRRRIAELMEQRVEELEHQLEQARRQLRAFTKIAREGEAGRLLAEREAELEAARANARGLTSPRR